MIDLLFALVLVYVALGVRCYRSLNEGAWALSVTAATDKRCDVHQEMLDRTT